jgi:hypothetical protein
VIVTRLRLERSDIGTLHEPLVEVAHARIDLAEIPRRGKPLAVEAVVDAITRVSWLAHDLRDTDFELDINPLIGDEQGCVAVDARLRVGN